ncbi:NAD(P)-dependent oxidoreductase [Agarivorans sp. MS3-6]|uniref:NAD(P)-dependent oxidoreductase n=1 Tax=Agarivorans sp. TSD2052 TaxID=2937286 RepID=UPI00200C67A2|nr:NAD(P)-binding oxidoreductase [Agarivorans sp. TSD2052]UPW18372.1 SDR family oxidoreductase [Agarivorans sp. TSD2052]
MTTLVVGASGATGQLLVEQLLKQGQKVKIIVRSVGYLSDALIHNQQLSITQANLLDMSDTELHHHVSGCQAVASCLGHNLTLHGMFGQPQRLVSDSVQRLCMAIERSKPASPVKFLLMNTSGNVNIPAGETISTAQSFIIGLIRMLLPPHADNEEAAAYLQSHFSTSHNSIEWAAIRPDSLVNNDVVTQYDVYSSPIRSAIFDAGKTSRINVAHFMTQLIINELIWQQWKGQWPVIYNASN